MATGVCYRVLNVRRVSVMADLKCGENDYRDQGHRVCERSPTLCPGTHFVCSSVFGLPSDAQSRRLVMREVRKDPLHFFACQRGSSLPFLFIFISVIHTGCAVASAWDTRNATP